MSTGINIPRLKNMAMIDNIGKSFPLVIQSLGRIMRKHKEKGDSVYCLDFVDCFTYSNDTYSLKHFYQRSQFYTDEGHRIVEKEIDLGKYTYTDESWNTVINRIPEKIPKKTKKK